MTINILTLHRWLRELCLLIHATATRKWWLLGILYAAALMKLLGMYVTDLNNLVFLRNFLGVYIDNLRNLVRVHIAVSRNWLGVYTVNMRRLAGV